MKHTTNTKKLLTVLCSALLVLCMLASLVACGGSGDDETTTTAPAATKAPAQTKVTTTKATLPEGPVEVEVPEGQAANGFKWTAAGDGITITGYTGKNTEEVIPDKINGKPVTAIEKGAFRSKNFKLIRIPDTVTAIGDDAFRSCTSLKEITLPSSLVTIGKSAFYEAGLTTVEIPDSVTTIEKEAFCQSSLGSVKFGKNVKDIGVGAFRHCDSLNDITIADGAANLVLEDGILYNKDKTKLILAPRNLADEFEVPSSVKVIGDSALEGCTGITGIVLPAGLTEIGEWAFRATKIESIDLPDSISKMGQSIFRECGSLKSIVLPENLESLETYMFFGCGVLESAVIGNATTKIAGYAFYQCGELTSVVFGKGIQTVGAAAFNDCTKLADIYYRGSADEWANVAFKATVPSTVNYTYNYAG